MWRTIAFTQSIPDLPFVPAELNRFGISGRCRPSFYGCYGNHAAALSRQSVQFRYGVVLSVNQKRGIF